MTDIPCHKKKKLKEYPSSGLRKVLYNKMASHDANIVPTFLKGSLRSKPGVSTTFNHK